MMKQSFIIPSLLFILITQVIVVSVVAQELQNNTGFISNESVIKGLYTQPDLEDPVSIFKYVFKNLEKEVDVYPSENYYYFVFPAYGKTLWGSISLSAHNRDNGILSFGYIEKSNDFLGEEFDAIGGSKDFTKDDGLILEKINPFRYSVKYDGKIVIFNLKKLLISPPVKANLIDGETFVGPNFDESGLQFFLIYNKDQKHLYWVLNEDQYVPEEFEFETKYLLIGKRTGFAFYNDTLNNRKILIGVDGYNVLKNNWYDGPFDQMPDNYVYTGQLEVRKYIESVYPADSGKIDKYGNYLEEEGVRLAVAPYYAYYSREDLVALMEECIKTASSPSELYRCVTEQIFYWPD